MDTKNKIVCFRPLPEKMSVSELAASRVFIADGLKRGTWERVETLAFPLEEFEMKEKEPKTTPVKKKSKKHQNPTQPTPLMAFMAKTLYNRRESTLWSQKELEAYEFVKASYGDDNAFKDDIRTVSRYYQEERKKEDHNARRDLVTCLNNWTGELDRANNYKFPVSKAVHYDIDTPPDNWIQIMENKLGHSDFEHEWREISKSLRIELLKDMEHGC